MMRASDANVRTKLSGPPPVDAQLRAAIQSGAKVRTNLSAALPIERAALFMAIDAERVRLDIPMAALALAGGVSPPHYERLRRKAGHGVTARYLVAVLRGLRSVRAADTSKKRPKDLSMARAAYVGCLAAAARAHGLALDVVEAQLKRKGEFTGDAAWREASKARASALYLASVEVGVPGGMLATLVGLSPAAVSLALNRVEDRRDEPDFDKAIEQAAEQVRGE